MDNVIEAIKNIQKVNERTIELLEDAKYHLDSLAFLSENYFKEELDGSYIEELTNNINNILDAAQDERVDLYSIEGKLNKGVIMTSDEYDKIISDETEKLITDYETLKDIPTDTLLKEILGRGDDFNRDDGSLFLLDKWNSFYDDEGLPYAVKIIKD